MQAKQRTQKAFSRGSAQADRGPQEAHVPRGQQEEAEGRVRRGRRPADDAAIGGGGGTGCRPSRTRCWAARTGLPLINAAPAWVATYARGKLIAVEEHARAAKAAEVAAKKLTK